MSQRQELESIEKYWKVNNFEMIGGIIEWFQGEKRNKRVALYMTLTHIFY